MDILWRRRRQSASVHPRERAVVWYNPSTGKHATPMLNNVPMPERYRRQGYIRREFDTLRSLDTYCKEAGVVNEKAHFDSNGRGYDDEPNP